MPLPTYWTGEGMLVFRPLNPADLGLVIYGLVNNAENRQPHVLARLRRMNDMKRWTISSTRRGQIGTRIGQELPCA